MERRSRRSERRPVSLTEKRKSDHLRICLEEEVNARNVTTGFEEIFLVHRALPEINRDDVNLSTRLFGHEFSAPIIVEGITGGTLKALKINASIAEAVERLGLGMGVGSQRAALEDSTLEKTFTIAREKAPNAFLIANIGGPQLAKGYSLQDLRRAVEMIDADALAIHLNPLQEAVQPEGETTYRGILESIRRVARDLEVPVIVKETGAGISAEDAKMLEAAGVAGIDVSGAGGTSWAAVEYHRAKRRGNESSRRLGEVLWDWGIPTAVSLVETVQSVSVPVIASGGIRSGNDAAKAIALGASLVGLASPVLAPALKGAGEVEGLLNDMIDQLRNVMFLVGADSVEALRSVPLVLTGKTAEWLRARGFEPDLYARRKLNK
ncbi:type 2 isopentenyl-diphosphate Delta-isomerase [Candidatus Bathyarchaeota archaeon]|nr:MAG: type 2 isopentenyl-diphosphate Delta-isomerase [Candidatus Bathyarchaeota archaeon]RLG95097.1 MAG: type 2 isopentenyl-diphosphate Delta-isomerase [Candidatus Bathyarchaeota archaeon]